MSWLGLPAADLAMAAAAVLGGVPLIVIDAREHRLPDRITGPLAIALLVSTAVDDLAGQHRQRWLPTLLTGLGMVAAGYLLAVISPDAFGLGDVKLLGVIGLALGHLDPQTIVLWLLALAACSLGWLLLAPLADRHADRSVPWRKRQIAFGPPMIAAWWLVYLVLAIAGAG